MLVELAFARDVNYDMRRVYCIARDHEISFGLNENGEETRMECVRAGPGAGLDATRSVITRVSTSLRPRPEQTRHPVHAYILANPGWVRA